MTEEIEPFDGGPKMQSLGWSQLWAASMTNGVIDDARLAYQTSQSLLVYSDEDGRQVKVKPGLAHLDGRRYVNDDIAVVDVPANSSGQPRKDWVVVFMDTVLKTGVITVLTGTPGTSPNPPPIPRVFGGQTAFALALLEIPANFTSVAKETVHGNREWCGTQASVWRDYAPEVANLSGPFPQRVADDGNFARFRIDGSTVTVKYRCLTLIASGSGGPTYGIRLPFAATYSNTPGHGTVQNAVAQVRTVDSLSYVYGMLEIGTADGSNLTVPSDTADRFSIEYEATIL